MKVKSAATLLWLKDAARYTRVVLILLGALCMPWPVVNPEAITTVFPWLTSGGSLVQLGLIVIAAGAGLVAASFLGGNQKWGFASVKRSFTTVSKGSRLTVERPALMVPRQ